MGVNARLLVSAPEYDTSPYSLLRMARDRTAEAGGPSGKWQFGVGWRSNCGGADVTYDECINSSPWASGAPEYLCVNGVCKNINAILDDRGTTPFTVFSRMGCSTVDFFDVEEQLIRDAYAKAEDFQVERAFWTGNVHNQPNVVMPHLAEDTAFVETNPLGYTVTLQTAATVVTGHSITPPCAIGLLESNLAACLVGEGMIHVPSVALAVLEHENLVIRTGDGKLRSPAGHIYVIGGGYPGTGPDGANPDPNSTWIYATGPVFYYRSDIAIISGADSLIKSTNTASVIAERNYTIGFECCHLAVPMCMECTLCVADTVR